MSTPQQSFSILSFLLVLHSAKALEPLKDSTATVAEAQATRLLRQLDKDGDQRIEEAEDEAFWKKRGQYDRDGDGALNLDELKKVREPHIDSPGRKLLNVLFKQTAQGGVYLDFYFPDKDVSSKKPVVVFTHGGGWAAGSKSKAGTGSFQVVHRALLKEGFCVLSVGYRKVNQGGDTVMRDCVIDCKDGIRFVSAHHKELGIDPSKIYA
ncbi:MAG: hypothetical protein ACQKBU_04225, partial [Verrucomicrobiales bacterium]